ncbi:type IV secretory system conjugative DNA transfer family protein [Thermodesulfobacteriota bacterium]
MSNKSIELGKTKNRNTVSIFPKTRETHMQILGATGEGKSKIMENMIRQDIANNEGVCLLDPHGYLYNDIVRWCETKHMLDRSSPKKIILFDPSEEEWTFGFNPLRLASAEISFHVDAMVKAVAQVWGGEDQDKTPLLKRCLRILFHALVEKGLSLYEAQHLIDPVDEEVRKYITRDIADVSIKKQWNYFNSLKPKPFYDDFGSSISRMMEFLASPIIRNIVGQIEKTIDFRKIMDEGWILLVNLSPGDSVSDANARLLGTLIINDLFMKARGRPKKSRPFYLYVDECGLFINEDIGRILSEGRKFGLHLTLASQNLAQLKDAGERVYRAVMQNAKTKVVFGGLDPEEAEILAKQLFLGEFDLEEEKKILSKPVVVNYIKSWLESYSKSKGSVVGGGHSSGVIDGPAAGRDKWSETDSISSSDTETETYGRHESLEPILKERPGGVFDLQEQIYKAMDLMVNQPEQHAIIKLPKKHTKFVKTPFVEDGFANDDRVRRFKEKSYNLTNFANPKKLAEAEIEKRQRLLLKNAQDNKDDYVQKPTKTKRISDGAEKKTRKR